MIWTPSLASCITGRIFSLIADTCIHKGLKLSTSSNKLMSVMLVPGWASVINEARSSISDAWSSIPWTMITGLKQNIFVRDNNKSAKKSSRETKFAMSSTVLDVVQASECKEPADWPQQKGIWKPINKHGLLRGWLLFQRGIWRQLQGIWIWRPPWLFGKCIWYNTFVFTWTVFHVVVLQISGSWMKRSFAYAKRTMYLLLFRRSQHSKIKRYVLFRWCTRQHSSAYLMVEWMSLHIACINITANNSKSR